jgi:hypothetical protein
MDENLKTLGRRENSLPQQVACLKPTVFEGIMKTGWERWTKA